MLVSKFKILYRNAMFNAFPHSQLLNQQMEIDKDTTHIELPLSTDQPFCILNNGIWPIYFSDDDGNELGVDLINIVVKDKILSAKIHREKIRLL